MANSEHLRLKSG